MKHVLVNKEQVPALGLGTWQLKGRDCSEAVRKALNLGYRHIDTAQIYENEEKVGKGIEESNVDREDIFLTTKLWKDGLEPENVRNSMEKSLERLGTDYVDLVLIHWPFPELDLESALREMDKLVEDRKAKNIGISNFNTSQIERAQELSDNHLMTNQVEYHPFLDQSEVLEKCREEGMMLTAYSPLGRGQVVGNEVLKDIGRDYEKTEAQVALRWLLQQEKVSAIPKSSSFKHIKENFEIFDFKLTENEMNRISQLKTGERKVNPRFAPEWD